MHVLYSAGSEYEKHGSDSTDVHTVCYDTRTQAKAEYLKSKVTNSHFLGDMIANMFLKGYPLKAKTGNDTNNYT